MANFKLTQTGEQIQADLDLLDKNSATQGQVLTADGTGRASWQNASNVVTSVNGQTGDVTVASYSLPVANSATLGGVKPVTKTSAMTQEVGVDTTGKLFTTPSSGGSSGGSQIGGGYTFDCSSDMHTIHYWILGTANGVYGWHYISDDDYLTLTNVSLVVFEDMNAPSGELTTLTTNALYTFDGKPINTYSDLSSAVGKLCYLRKNCQITFMD